jgi:20S proteasome alpha/beta subunit
MEHQVTAAAPIKRTTRPIVTGTSVLGIVYDGGVLLAADTLLSYGGMAKHQGVSRLQTVQNTVIAASGELEKHTMQKKQENTNSYSCNVVANQRV